MAKASGTSAVRVPNPRASAEGGKNVEYPVARSYILLVLFLVFFLLLFLIKSNHKRQQGGGEKVHLPLPPGIEYKIL